MRYHCKVVTGLLCEMNPDVVGTPVITKSDSDTNDIIGIIEI